MYQQGVKIALEVCLAELLAELESDTEEFSRNSVEAERRYNLAEPPVSHHFSGVFSPHFKDGIISHRELRGLGRIKNDKQRTIMGL
jgi:hypothetical protein